MQTRKVVILRQGHYGEENKKDCDQWIALVKKHLEEVTKYDLNTKKYVSANMRVVKDSFFFISARDV